MRSAKDERAMVNRRRFNLCHEPDGPGAHVWYGSDGASEWRVRLSGLRGNQPSVAGKNGIFVQW
jgi:hypothetical protein